MAIKDLPKPGINFRAATGSGNFQKKLSGAVRCGDLRNLRDNQKAIVEAVKKYQGAIRTKGGLSRLQRRDAWLKIRASDKTITKGDRGEIQQVLKHLGRPMGWPSAAGGVKKKVADKKAVKAKASDGANLTEEQKKRNLARTKERDELVKQRHETRFAGGKAETTSFGAADQSLAPAGQKLTGGLAGVPRDLRARKALETITGTAADLNVQRNTTGFAQNFNDKKPPDNLKQPPAPLRGVRPIGL